MDKEKTTRQRLAEWSKTPEGRESYEKVAEEMRREISEKPMNLVEQIGSYNIVPYIDDKIAKLQDMWREEKVSFDWDDLKDMIEDVARHFAQWGAEHRGSSEIPKDLDEAAEKYQDDHTIQRYAGGRLLAPEFDVTIKEVFIAGAEWQADHTLLPEDTVLFNKGVEEGKRLMMEDAVEGRINPFGFHNAISTKDPAFTEVLDKLKPCDKVRVIIVKEDEK